MKSDEVSPLGLAETLISGERIGWILPSRLRGLLRRQTIITSPTEQCGADKGELLAEVFSGLSLVSR